MSSIWVLSPLPLTLYDKNKSFFYLYQALNMLISSEKLGILSRESVGNDTLWEPASIGHFRNCSFWLSSVGFFYHHWSLCFPKSNFPPCTHGNMSTTCFLLRLSDGTKLKSANWKLGTAHGPDEQLLWSTLNRYECISRKKENKRTWVFFS